MRLADFRPSRVLVFFGILAAVAVAQSPGEIRLHSAPYTLPPVVLVTQANTVPLTAVVRDESGKVIGGLTEDRFRLFDDGVPQKLTAFHVTAAAAAAAAHEDVAVPAGGAVSPAPPAAGAAAAAPRYVSLLFDDVNSDKGDLMEARSAATRFLKEELGPGDHMALFTISSYETVPFTQDRAALAAAIARIGPHPRASARGLAECPRIPPYEAYLIAVLHNAAAIQSATADALSCGNEAVAQKAQQIALQASDCGLNCTFGTKAGSSGTIAIETQANATWEMARGISQNTLDGVHDAVDYTAQQPGQRIVVLASSGFLSDTLEGQREQIIRDALRAGVVINALDARGLYTEAPSGPIDETRGFLPMITWAFEEGNKMPEQEAQEDAMASLALATGGLFFHNNNDLTLGFERLGLAPAATYDLAFTPTPLVRDGKLHQLKLALSPKIRGASIEARRGYFAPPPGPTPAELEQALNVAMRGSDTAAAVPAEVEVAAQPGVARVRVRVRVGVIRPSNTISLVAGLFTADGQFVTGERGEIVLALKDATFKKLRKSGLAPSFNLSAPARQYRLRVVVEDASGALTEINREVRLP